MKTKKAWVTLAGKGICCSHCRSVARCYLRGWRMGANTVHEGIFKSNFTAGRRRENSSVAFGKVAVSNELLGNAFFWMMLIVITKRLAGPCKRGIPRSSLWKKGISHSSHHFHSQCVTSSFVLQSIVHFGIPRGKKERKEEKRVKKKTKTKKPPQVAGLCCSHCREVECCTIGYEGWARAAVHGGFFVINFT